MVLIIMCKTAVLLPECLLAVHFQVSCPANFDSWRSQFLNLILEYGTDIITYECSESSFEGYRKGLLRLPHGIDYYQKIEGYSEHCELLAARTYEKINAMSVAGYQILAIVGIENSPSCSVNYMYTHHGMQKRPGIFMNALKECLYEEENSIPYIGINRRYPRKALEGLKRILQKSYVKEE